MTLQVLGIAIYDRAGRRRELLLRPGRVNIVTGESLTGKSALIDIVDYCLGRERYNIPSGVISDTVVWYALHLMLPEGEAVIGRPAPQGTDSTRVAYLEVGGELALPDFDALRPNSNAAAVELFLTEAVGITANLNVPPEGQSRASLQANISHARFLLFQPQSLIADREMLFYRQKEPFIAQSIKDTLPYFLGATGDDQYDRLQQLRRMRRDLRFLERRQEDEEAVRGRENSRATALIAEAQNVGISAPGPLPGDFQGAMEVLRGLTDWRSAKVDTEPGNALATMQEARRALLTELRATQGEIDAARSFIAAEENYKDEAIDQRHRLASINLYKTEAHSRCPLCEQDLIEAVPKIEEIRKSLTSLVRQISAAGRQRPRLEAFMNEREDRVSDIRRRLRENNAAIEALMVQEEALQRERSTAIEQARVVGRISLFLESVRVVEEDAGLYDQLDDLRARIKDMASALSDEVVEDRLTSILQVIGRDMTRWAKRLGLEHSEWPLGFDLDRLTVVAHRDSGPIRLNQMGGGKNWMGYHVITHIALHKFFRQRRRPVPGILMLDQPTQVFFPPENVADRSIDELGDEDRRAVRRLFEFIFLVTDKLSPDLQVIITDHADLNEEWFQESVVETWRGGKKLVPEAWLKG